MAESNPSIDATMAERVRRMGWCVTGGDDRHEEADALLCQAARLLPGDEELASLNERVPKAYEPEMEGEPW